MARQYLMGWQGAPQFRWRKTHKGKAYVVTCAELKAVAFTQDGSYKLANAWWHDKLAELEGPTRTETLLQEVGSVPPSEMTRVIEQAMIYRRILAEGPMGTPSVEQAERIIGVGPIDDDRRRDDYMARIVEKVRPASADTLDRSMKVNAERWLDVIRGDVEPTSFREIKEFARWFCTLPLAGEGTDVSAIDGPKVEEFYLHLKTGPLAPATRKKRWSFFRRFVKYVWGKGLIDLPRNLDLFSFTVDAQEIKRYATEDVRSLLKSLKPRLRCYALLALNCSMNGVDIGKLRKDMVDLEAGTLVRKRVKTTKKKGVPVVVYRLWPETVSLLRQLQADHPTLMLTSKRNTPLWTSVQNDDGKTPKKDLILNQWRKKKLPIPFGAFRSIGSTLIKSHRVHGQCSKYYLGQAPQSVEDRHYSAPPDVLLGEALDWLRTELLG